MYWSNDWDWANGLLINTWTWLGRSEVEATRSSLTESILHINYQRGDGTRVLRTCILSLLDDAALSMMCSPYDPVTKGISIYLWPGRTDPNFLIPGSEKNASNLQPPTSSSKLRRRVQAVSYSMSAPSYIGPGSGWRLASDFSGNEAGAATRKPHNSVHTVTIK